MWGRYGGDVERYGAIWRLLLHPRDAPRCALDTSEIHPRYSRDTPEIHPRYTRDTPEIHPRYTRDVPEMCPSRALKVAAAAAAARAAGVERVAILDWDVHHLITYD